MWRWGSEIVFRRISGQCDASCSGGCLCLVLLDVCEKFVSRSRVEIWIGRYCENGPFTSHSSASVCLGEEEHTKPRTFRFFFPNDCLPGSASQAHSSHDHDPYPISFPHSPIPQYFRRIYPSILGTVRVWHREDIVARTLALVSARCDRLPASCFVAAHPLREALQCVRQCRS